MINSSGLLGPQVKHTKALVDSIYLNGFAIDLSETGTGKTFAAAAVIRELNRPCVVVCPKAVIPQWKKILNKFDVEAVVINYELIGRGNTKYMKWKKVQDPMQPWNEKAVRELPQFTFSPDTLVILDEGHRCKGADTSNSWMMIMLVEQGYNVLVSSATVATTPLDMKAVGYLSQLHRLYNYSDFCRIHGGQWVGRWGAMTFDAASAEAKKSMLALNEYFFKIRKCASRMTVDDFGNLFPDTHIVAEAYDLGTANTPKAQAIYDAMEAEIARLEERSEGYSEHIFAIIMEARRKVEILKVPLFVEMVEDLYAEGKSVVLFVNFTDTVEAVIKRLPKALKQQIGYIVGGQNAVSRQDDIDSFNADRKRILIANISAGGVGISLHDLNGKFPRATIISPNYSAVQLIQALGRVHRQGGLTKSYQRVVFAAGTIEEVACRKVQFRINNLSTLNDADLRSGIKLFS